MKHASISDFVDKVQTWEPRKLGDGSTFRYIDIGSVSQVSKSIEDSPLVQAEKAPSRARQIVRSGDILVSTVRPNLNAVALVPEELDGSTASTGFAILRPHDALLDRHYLFHWVRTQSFISEMMRQATGQSYPAVSDKIVKASKIPLPTLDEQKRIAGILDQVDALRRLRTRALDKLSTLGQAIFHKMFGNLHSNKNGFDRVSLGEVIKVSSGRGLAAKDMKSGEFPVYGGNGINGYHDEGPVPANTIVVGRVGAYCGAVHTTDRQCWVTDNALIVKKLVPVNTSYLATALEVAELNQYAGRAAQPLVSGSRIYPVEILFPPIEAQDEFARAQANSKDQKVFTKKSEQTLDDLFAALQHRAFQGEL